MTLGRPRNTEKPVLQIWLLKFDDILATRFNVGRVVAKITSSVWIIFFALLGAFLEFTETVFVMLNVSRDTADKSI